MMNVLHISGSDYVGAGGTSAALHQLHTALKQNGVNSKILCKNKTSGSRDSMIIPRSRIVERLIKEFTTPLGLNDLHGVSAFGIAKHPAFVEADVIHFHGIHGGHFNFLALPFLTNKKPTVWTLHDIWPITGHCTFFYDCLRWKTGCGKCPYPRIYPPVKRDATHWEWRMKKWTYERSNIALVVASRWYEEIVKQSMLANHPLYRIPWGVDTDAFKPLDRDHCRSVLGIPKGKKVLSFAAMNFRDTRKGGDLLIQALRSMPASLKKEMVVLTMGNGMTGFSGQIDMPSINLGWIYHDRLKAAVYSAADVFVSPTRAETFGLTLIESMACGTPVVSHDIGPVPELVRHGVTGYTARPESPDDLLAGLLQLLEDHAHCESLGRNGRQMIENEFTLNLETSRYSEVYQQVLKN